MPVCFQLYRKDGDGKTAANLAVVDAELRVFFGQPMDDKKYLAGWYDSIGFRLAIGKSWDEIREAVKDHDGLLKIVDYLEEHYQVNSFRSMR